MIESIHDFANNYEKMLNIANIDRSQLPRAFPMKQEDGESRLHFIGEGAKTGGLVGLGVVVAKRALHGKIVHPILNIGVGATAGALVNNNTYRKKKDEKTTNKAKKLVSKKK
jgi:hypothetical protein